MCDTLSELKVVATSSASPAARCESALDFAASVPNKVSTSPRSRQARQSRLDKVSRELMNGYKDESGDTIRGVGLSADQVDRIKRFSRYQV